MLIPRVNVNHNLLQIKLLLDNFPAYTKRKCNHNLLWLLLVSEWVKHLTVDRFAHVQELAWVNTCMHQSSLMKMTVRIENLHRVTELDLGLYQLSKIPLSHFHSDRS